MGASFYYPPTGQITTGNPATVNDAYDTTKFNNGAKMTPGAAVYQVDASGRVLKYRYVRLNCTAAPTFIVGPVFWKDNTFTVVTALSTEAIMGQNGMAGVLVNASATNGNWVLIQVAGYLALMTVAASTNVGDALFATSGTQLTGRTAAQTAPTNRVLAWAITSTSSGKSDILITCEDYGN